MASKRYALASPEGVAWAGSQYAEGDVIEVDLSDEQELALVAAGWLEHSAKKPTETEEEL